MSKWISSPDGYTFNMDMVAYYIKSADEEYEKFNLKFFDAEDNLLHEIDFCDVNSVEKCYGDIKDFLKYDLSFLEIIRCRW